MLTDVVPRLLLALLTTWAISVLAFVILQHPTGDYITAHIAQMTASGTVVSQQLADALREQYGLEPEAPRPEPASLGIW